MSRYLDHERQELKVARIIKDALIALVVLVFILSSIGFVGAGDRGVVLRLKAVTGKTYNPGMFFKIPFVESVVRMNVQTQKEEVNASSASKDLQDVSSTIALNYSLDPGQVATIYRDIGREYKTKIIDPSIQESVKAVTAKYTAEELITKREIVSGDIKEHLRERLGERGITVESFSIINFNFSASFNQAIESKVTAEQNALASKNKLAQVQYEAQQAIEEAKGKAEALRIESQAISSNPKVLELRAIEKWNGQLPQVTSGAVPFINIK